MRTWTLEQESDVEANGDCSPDSNGSGSSSHCSVQAGVDSYVVSPGDCFSSVAFEHGFFWKTLWFHPDNAAVRALRKNPNVLLPGDRISIPPFREKSYARPTEQRHTFRLLGVPAKLRLQIMEAHRESHRQPERHDDGTFSQRVSRPAGPGQSSLEVVPRANVPYVLEIDGKLTTGRTDSDGVIESSIPPNARSGRLVIAPGTANEVTMPLNLGQLDPLTELSGLQGRLVNLGYLSGPMTGQLDSETADALRRFQRDHDLPQTGQPDEATREKLLETHGY